MRLESAHPMSAEWHFLIALNEFDGAPRYSTQALRKALALSDHIPVVTVDARDRNSCREALIAVKQWRYAPLMLNGKAEAFVLTVPLSFNLVEPAGE